MAFHVLFRMDDICPRMNYEKFRRFQDLFDCYHIKPIIGIVPDNQDDDLKPCEELPDFWGRMRRLKNQGWKIAMHGYTHVYATKDRGIFNNAGQSEFAGLPYPEQLDKIQKGIAILKAQDLATDLFMAPSDTVDENTLKALRESGFRYITIGSATAPYDWHGLTIVPCREAKPRVLWGLSTVCFHPNTAPEEIFLTTEKFLQQNDRFVIDFQSACQLPRLPLAQAMRQERIYGIIHDNIVGFLYPVYKKMRTITAGAKIARS
ncbi:MAG: hypothetical protein H6Q65_33 [Firmicutes bacterium]|nr:hypothetical protein [Bacillota bacterium]